MEVNTVCGILYEVKAKAMIEALVKRQVDGQTLCYTLAEVDDREQVVDDEKVGETSAKVECKAVLDKMAARKTEVKVHTLVNTVSELRGIETLDTLSDTVAENEVESLGDKQVEIKAKALEYQMAERQAEVKVEKLGDTSQRRE